MLQSVAIFVFGHYVHCIGLAYDHETIEILEQIYGAINPYTVIGTAEEE